MSLTGNAEGSVLRGKLSGLETIQGYSAYEVAVINGFKGTEEEWLASLKGDKGDKGEPFRYEDFTEEQLEALKGEKGDRGDIGPRGFTGDSYILTEADKAEIAGIVLAEIPAYDNTVEVV